MNFSYRKSKSKSKSRKLRILNKTNVYKSRTLNTIYENEYIDADFIHNYPKNMVRIREALKESGKYKINKVNVDKFINEQLEKSELIIFAHIKFPLKAESSALIKLFILKFKFDKLIPSIGCLSGYLYS